jgi:hypothetical protein
MGDLLTGPRLPHTIAIKSLLRRTFKRQGRTEPIPLRGGSRLRLQRKKAGRSLRLCRVLAADHSFGDISLVGAIGPEASMRGGQSRGRGPTLHGQEANSARPTWAPFRRTARSRPVVGTSQRGRVCPIGVARPTWRRRLLSCLQFPLAWLAVGVSDPDVRRWPTLRAFQDSGGVAGDDPRRAKAGRTAPAADRRKHDPPDSDAARGDEFH